MKPAIFAYKNFRLLVVNHAVNPDAVAGIPQDACVTVIVHNGTSADGADRWLYLGSLNGCPRWPGEDAELLAIKVTRLIQRKPFSGELPELVALRAKCEDYGMLDGTLEAPVGGLVELTEIKEGS